MSEDSYTIARVVFLLCLLVLVVPAFLGRRLETPTMLRYAAMWIGIAAGVALLYDFWKG